MMVTATKNALHLDFQWPDGGDFSAPVLWLRDVCPCSSCRVTQTQEKRVHLASLDCVAAEAIDPTSEGVTICWVDGHTSYYPRAFLEATHARITPAWKPWCEDYFPNCYDFLAFQSDDDCATSAITEFLTSGVLLLGAAGQEDRTLERLSARLGPVREVLFERIHNVKVDPLGYNVAHTSLALPPHNDFASYSWPPSVQALHMLVNDAVGGNSTILDGWGVLEEFRRDDPAAFDVLCRVPVPFREFDEHNETYACEPVVQLNARGQIVIFRYSNQLMQVMDHRNPETAAFYDAYYALSRRLLSTNLSRSFRLEGGQILVVASHRILHGREAIESSGHRHLQDAYFEHDNVRNRLTVLARSHD
ncbi:TauD/TfdA family dioxygenase [Luminiphilus sp.]|nr:TauD/TfdA family dioxygenase [Luminiphilus sp.]